MSKIVNVLAREVIDSRANPTVEAEVFLETGIMGRAIVPSGASTGDKEALELRDNDSNRYLGKGVLTAVNNVNTILKDAVVGMDCFDQEDIDNKLISVDGTKDKSRYGANAILSVSLACAHAAAKEKNIPLYEYLNDNNHKIPMPMLNILNGGSHADSSVDFQEYMIVPISKSTIKERVRVSSEIFYNLKSILKENKHITSVGDEGGFAPNLANNEEPLKYIIKAIEKAGYKPGEDVAIALDVAASEFYNSDTKLYEFKKSTNETKTTTQMIEYLEYLVNNYPIISIEDGLDQNDIEGWKLLTEKLGNKITLVGDDLFVTNYELLKSGIEKGLGNAILIKPNQIGTLTETIKTIKLAKDNNYKVIISHRSGETEDVTISHLAVAFASDYIKTGSISRSERVAKYNELIRIEENLIA